MKIILAIDAIHYPLTGIGRYTFELMQGFKQNPRINSLRLFALGKWVEPSFDILNILNKNQLKYNLFNTLRTQLARQSLVIEIYRQVTPVFYRWRLNKFKDYLFHAPNYFLPPFAGISVATIHDLSTLRYPQFHPKTRVRLVNQELPKTLARADHLIAITEAMRQEIINYCNWPAERISTIPLGVAQDFYPRPPEQTAPMLQTYALTPGTYCLCVATLEPRKNLLSLLDAYARLPKEIRKRFPLVLAGAAGWNSDDLHARIAHDQATGAVKYLRYVPSDQLPLLFAGARLFVFPSFYEGFGLPPLEAMASGIPVVTSTCSALRETTGGAAQLVEPEDIIALTTALQDGLLDENWRTKAISAGLMRAQLYSWNRCVEQTLDLYQKLL